MSEAKNTAGDVYLTVKVAEDITKTVETVRIMTLLGASLLKNGRRSKEKRGFI